MDERTPTTTTEVVQVYQVIYRHPAVECPKPNKAPRATNLTGTYSVVLKLARVAATSCSSCGNKFDPFLKIKS